jgi:hypothetical protein
VGVRRWGVEEGAVKRQSIDEGTDLSGRIKSLEQFTGSLVVRSTDSDAEVIPIHEALEAQVPVPRRSRIYLRGGGGQGGFAELTVTAPRPRPAAE